jgi:hypothetical protein
MDAWLCLDPAGTGTWQLVVRRKLCSETQPNETEVSYRHREQAVLGVKRI